MQPLPVHAGLVTFCVHKQRLVLRGTCAGVYAMTVQRLCHWKVTVILQLNAVRGLCHKEPSILRSIDATQVC